MYCTSGRQLRQAPGAEVQASLALTGKVIVKVVPTLMLLSTVIGANLFTEPYLLTGGGGPNGASSSPVLVMYQEGIQQGKPGYAAAIGVILVIGVLIIAFLQNRFASERD